MRRAVAVIAIVLVVLAAAVLWTRYESAVRRADTDGSRSQRKGAPVAPAPPVPAPASELRETSRSSAPILVRGTVFDEWGEAAAARVEVLAGEGERLAGTGSERSSGAYSLVVETAPSVLVVRATDRRGASGERRVAAVPARSARGRSTWSRGGAAWPSNPRAWPGRPRAGRCAPSAPYGSTPACSRASPWASK